MIDTLEGLKESLSNGWGTTIDEQQEYMKDILAWYGRITEMMKDATRKMMIKKATFLAAHDTKELKQYQYRDVLEVYLMDELLEVQELEGLLKVISKQVEAIRTSISTERAERELMRGGF